MRAHKYTKYTQYEWGKKTMKIKTTKTATPLAHKKMQTHTQNNKAQKGHIMNPKYTIYTGHKAIGNGKKAE